MPENEPAEVFVVDDDEAVRDSIKVLLEVHDLQVQDFSSTKDFVDHYRRPARGCLVLDQHLPGTTGLDFLASPEGRNLAVPVILITGQSSSDLEKRARAAGVAEYLPKPLGEKVLLEAVRRAIG